MKALSVVTIFLSLLWTCASRLLASGTSTPPPVFGTANAEAFQFESIKARVLAVDVGKGTVVLQEEKKKDAREITLKVDAKTSLKAGKEKLQLHQLAVGTLVKAVFDRAFSAIAIKIEKENT